MSASCQSSPSSFRFAGVPKGFQPGAGANFFNALFVASFNAVCAKPSFFLSSLWDSCVLRLIALILSSASSPGLRQGNSASALSSHSGFTLSGGTVSCFFHIELRDVRIDCLLISSSNVCTRGLLSRLVKWLQIRKRSSGAGCKSNIK